MITKSNWKRVGTISVDSGQMMLVDPCYVLPDEGGSGGLSYKDVLDTYGDNYNVDTIEVGNGIVSSTGYGDGSYDVFIKTVEDPSWGHRVAEMKIVFIEDDEDEEECEGCGWSEDECDCCYVCGEANLYCMCDEEDEDEM